MIVGAHLESIHIFTKPNNHKKFQAVTRSSVTIFFFLPRGTVEASLLPNVDIPIPKDPCMIYLPTFTINNQLNVAKCSIHGAFGV